MRSPERRRRLKGLSDLIDEFGAEFVTDPPCQSALAGTAGRQDESEFSGKRAEMFGNDLYAAC